MTAEYKEDRAVRIINELKNKYPEASCYDIDGRGLHFVSEIEPPKDHPEYDKAVEVIISSKPHKHLKMVQQYTIISGNLRLHLDDKVVYLSVGNKCTVYPNTVHWAESEGDECWVEIYSEPGWTAEDPIVFS